MTAPAGPIGYSQLAKDRPDYPSQAALRGINTTERTMREKAATLRAALDEAEAATLRAALDEAEAAWTPVPAAVPGSRLMANAAPGLDRANITRDIHWAAGAAL